MTGEIVGELPGSDLGKLSIRQVRKRIYSFLFPAKFYVIDSFIRKDGKVEMEVGLHTLDGEVVSLKQPLLVIEKKNGPNDEHMEIMGIVKKKVLFKTRPKPRAT